MLDAAAKLNTMQHEAYGDPEIETRIAQYEMAYRMQTSVPDLMDLSKEPDSVFELYGPESRKPGTYAANCLLARRLAERNVRFIQLYHRGWDQHSNLPRDIALQCQGTDQPTAALITDLKQRGLLDDTLVVWGGEFGRTVFSQGKLTDVNYGRDHHPRNFCMWVAGGGIKRGIVLGETDDFSYNVVSDPVSVYDLQATILHLLGIDHTKLTYRFQGRDFRLTDVHGEVVTRSWREASARRRRRCYLASDKLTSIRITSPLIGSVAAAYCIVCPSRSRMAKLTRNERKAGMSRGIFFSSADSADRSRKSVESSTAMMRLNRPFPRLPASQSILVPTSR